MRNQFEAGSTPYEFLIALGERLGTSGTNFRLRAIAYFREAFQISLADAMGIGAADIFPQGAATRDDINAQMMPIIEDALHIRRK